ncbi:DBIRD complex subunit ZNF326-like isoform X2 [Leptopilina boulardi]|uniref:DBIRD complex subunit ZNF326-like isoform X2 n=1 Tax=Leptopilina boulardi TaxID=63433 RepID=UPI0021F63973|nr:DBIRD complex subunit ZNF326-like isoform X2 [Leptopilina boulardi]
MNYGYNKYSSNMSPRGRGFNSRGGSSYRGRGGGGGGGGRDWNNSNSGGRGNYTSRGGFNKYNSNSNYDSRNKYNSGGSERYSNRGGRGEHSNAYKRPRDSYSGRDDHRSSSDSGRKRMRNDSYQGGGSSSSQRYSGSYGGSSTSGQYDDKRSSNSTYEEKRQNERTSSYHRSEDRHSASRNYTTPQPPRINDMAPPAPRYTSSRGRISRQTSSYRGRSSTRGRGGGGIHRGSRSDIILSRKRTLGTLDYRRKLLGSRSRDYIQRVRMTTTKMRRSGTTRLSGSKKDSAPSMKDKDRMAKAINAEFSDEDDDDNRSNWDEDEKPQGEDDENAEEDEDKAKKEEKIKPKQERTTEDEEEKDDAVKDDEEDPKPDEDDEEEVEGKEEDNKEENARSGSDELPSRRDGRRFIKLICVHCQHRSVTFKEYSLHLYSGKHNSAMRRVAAKHKAMLARMRIVQRQEQRRVEARDEARGTLPSRTIFCPVCKLNYRSLKAVHNLSDSHRQIKRFLTPFCRVCRIQLRSPMTYETHVCSLDHIRKKNLQDETKKRDGDEVNSSGGEDEDKEMNLENFMTLDSVGDVDAEEDEENGDKKKKEKSEGEGTDTEKKAKTKQMIKVGSEYIKRVEVQFCELCKVYLPRSENNERAVALHCSTRSHLKRYVRDNDDKALRRQAERIHLQSSSSTTTTNSLNTSENTKGGSTNADQPNSDSVASGNDETKALSDNGNVHESKDDEEDEEEEEEEEEEEDAEEESEKTTKNNSKENEADEEDEDEYGVDSGDKLFDDVDKDLGNILREAETGARSSDDEDSRYDRFRNTGKKQHAKEKNGGDGKQQNEDKETIVKKSETKPKTVA